MVAGVITSMNVQNAPQKGAAQLVADQLAKKYPRSNGKQIDPNQFEMVFDAMLAASQSPAPQGEIAFNPSTTVQTPLTPNGKGGQGIIV